MKYQSITERRNERQKLLKKLERWFELSKVIAIAIILLSLMMCGGCSSTASSERIKEPCINSVVTYGEAIECMIKLNEVNK